MKFNWIKRAAELEKNKTPFAIATVINTVAPTSAKPMSKAIIHSDGTIEGWIGGGCSINAVINESLNCIKSGKSIILRLSSDGSSDDGVTYKKEVFLNCESGGILEFHIEPVLPMTKLIIYGNTPIAYALANMGHFLNYDCCLCSPDLNSDLKFSDAVTIFNSFKIFSDSCVVVVATQGENDLEALRSGILSKPQFLSLIVSRKKASSLLDQLEKQGIAKDEISKIKFPGGMDIGAKTPEEIAVSVLAELIEERNCLDSKEQVIIEMNDEAEELDPVCGMSVVLKDASDSYEFDGKTFYFCCSGCKAKFSLEPSSYIV